MMSAGEICRDFRHAKDRKKQISILSQMNLTSTECIILILFEHGEIQKTPEKSMLVKALDVLEKCISGTEEKLDALYMRYNSIAVFLEKESAGAEVEGMEMGKRNCLRTLEEKRMHERAVKLRKMTDAQLARVFDNMQDMLHLKEKEAAEKDKSLEGFLKSLSVPGAVPGVGLATVNKIMRYAEEGGFLGKHE